MRCPARLRWSLWLGLLMLLSAGLSVPLTAVAQTLAFTFEGGFDARTQPQAAAWNRALLQALKEAKVKALLFPHGRVVDTSQGFALVREWGERGHAIGNGTYAQRDYGSPRTSFADFRRDVLAAQALLDGLPGWTRRLRCPGLNEGDTADKRDRLRDWMRLHDYRPAPVSIDPLDELYDQRWRRWRERERERSGDTPPLDARLREAYLNHLWGRANEREALARRVLGRSPAHVMRLHLNELNALLLDDIVRLFRRKGWRIVSAEEAYRDPLYDREPTVVPAGGSIVVALARQGRQKGLRSADDELRLEQRRLERRGF